MVQVGPAGLATVSGIRSGWAVPVIRGRKVTAGAGGDMEWAEVAQAVLVDGDTGRVVLPARGQKVRAVAARKRKTKRKSLRCRTTRSGADWSDREAAFRCDRAQVPMEREKTNATPAIADSHNQTGVCNGRSRIIVGFAPQDCANRLATAAFTRREALL